MTFPTEQPQVMFANFSSGLHSDLVTLLLHRCADPYNQIALSDEMIILENGCCLPLLTAALRRQRIAKSLRLAQATEILSQQ